MRHRLLAWGFVATLACSPIPSAQAATQDPATQIDAVARRFAALATVPSISVAVVRDGSVIYLKSFGYRELAKQLPADPDTVYDIASLSKQFTAAAYYMLVEEGKLDPHARLSRYLPAIEHSDEVTLDQLAGMTSGYQDTGADPKQLSTALPLLFTPGTQFSYSNTNYELLGLLIQKASGMPYETFVRERIIEPLHLASWSLLGSTSIPENHATGYFFPTPVRGYIDPDSQKKVFLGASGDMQLSVRDMAVWDADLLAHRVVSENVWKAMSTGGVLRDGAPSGYGAGEFVSTFRGHRLISHAGNHSDSTSENWILPDDHLAIAVFCNGGLAPVGALVSAIAAVSIPDGANGTGSPPPATHQPLPSADVTTAARAWLERALSAQQSSMPTAPAARERDYLDDFAATGRRYGTTPERFTPLAIQDRGTAVASFYSVVLGEQSFTFFYDVTAKSGVSLAPVWNP